MPTSKEKESPDAVQYPKIKPFSPNYGIVRVEHKDQNTWGWAASLRRNGATVGRRYFADMKHGGMENALAAARAYRDFLLEQYPPLVSREFRQRLRKHNTSGVAGVSRLNQGSGAWVATTQLRGGKVLTKQFSVSRYGEEEAKRLAIAERNRQLLEDNELMVRDQNLGD
ncbi:AP2/ERF family transcription factor [Sphingomonas sp. NCPPB 2930]